MWYLSTCACPLTCKQTFEPVRVGAGGHLPGTESWHRPSTEAHQSTIQTAPEGSEGAEKNSQRSERHSFSHSCSAAFSHTATGEGSCSEPSINTALVSSLQNDWQVAPRVFLPHRSDPPYTHPNHGYTAAFALALIQALLTKVRVHMDTCRKERTSLKLYLSPCLRSSRKRGSMQHQNLVLQPQLLYPSRAAFLYLVTPSERKAADQSHRTKKKPLKNTNKQKEQTAHPAENTCWRSSCISQRLLFLSRL